MNQKTKIQLSIMMFLQFFIWGAWYVTAATYWGEIGFQGSDIGNAYSTVSLAAIIAPLFVGMIADRFFEGQKVLGVLHLMGGVVMWWVASLTDASEVYWVVLLYSICYMPTIAIANAVAFHQMTNPEKEFPTIRVLGTIGWIVAGLMIAGMEKSAMPMKIAAIASILTGLYCFSLPTTPPHAKGEKVTIGKLLGFDALKLMKDRSFAILIVSSLLISIPLAFYYAFTNLFLVEEGMENAAGKMTLGQVSEIVFMLLMPLFFRKLGVKKMILIGMFCWVARYMLFAFGNNDEMIFMFYFGIILHGICYDFFFVTGQIYVDKAAPESVRSSAQGLIALVTYGIGMYIGSIYSGQVVEKYTSSGGGHDWLAIWTIPAILAFIVMLVFAVLFKSKNEASNGGNY
jgi:nucleoside transporter